MKSHKKWTRRDFGRLLGVGALGTALTPAIASRSALAEEYPSKPIALFVGWPPGGVSDTSARLIANYSDTSLGNMLVENKPGATGSIAARHVARSKPDGYSLLFAANPEICINQFISGDTSFDPGVDLTPIIGVYNTTHALVVPKDSPYATLAAVLDAERASPGTIKFASMGTGAPSHLAGEALALEAGVKLKHIPFAGGAAATTAVMGGHVELCIVSIATAKANVDSQLLRILAVTSQDRVKNMPDVPTVREVLGVSRFDFPVFAGLFAPTGIERARLDAVYQMADKALRSDKVVAMFEKNDIAYPNMNSDQYAEYIREQISQSSELIRKLGLSKGT